MGSQGESSATVSRRRLTTASRSRIEAALSEPVRWTPAPDFETAEPPPALAELAVEALAEDNLVLDGTPVLVRHSAGQQGLPRPDHPAEHRFAIDLSESSTSAQGGALLFFDDTGKGHGWKAEQGAITLWRGEDPILSEINQHGPVRLTLVGSARSR